MWEAGRDLCVCGHHYCNLFLPAPSQKAPEGHPMHGLLILLFLIVVVALVAVALRALWRRLRGRRLQLASSLSSMVVIGHARPPDRGCQYSGPPDCRLISYQLNPATDDRPTRSSDGKPAASPH